jgi:hypothetical protein
MKNYKEVTLTEGEFAGKTVVFETSGTTVNVFCPKCDWSDWQTFFIKDFTENDIGRKCSRCNSKLKFKENDND